VVTRIDGAAIIVRTVLDADAHQGRPYALIVIVRVVGFATIDAPSPQHVGVDSLRAGFLDKHILSYSQAAFLDANLYQQRIIAVKRRMTPYILHSISISWKRSRYRRGYV